jgi:UDPglucose 6-dehydrogenase
LVSIAARHGYDFSMMRGVIEVNDQQRERIVAKIAAAAERDARGADSLRGVVVGVWGLTFKAHTDDLRESPSLAIIDRLWSMGATIQAYDPTTTGPLDHVQSARLGSLAPAADPVAAATGADVVAVLTEWPDLVEVDLAAVAAAMRGDAIVDARNLFDPDDVKSVGLRYDGVGRR